MADTDNVFTFDPKPFINGLKKITNQMGGMQKNAGNMSKSVSKGIINATAKIGILALAFKGVKAAIDAMPEIGKTFDIAKNVIMKNLFFPLRKAIFPLLQKFLDWVRDNRAMFVKWGQTLANVFETVVSLVGNVINVAKNITDFFLNAINRIFGMSAKNIGELFNVLSFKFSVVLTFLSQMLGDLFKTFEPALNLLLDIFGQVFKFITEILGSVGEGLGPFIKELGPIFESIFSSIKSIVDMLFTSKEALKFWKSTFKFLGEVIGVTLVTAFKIIDVAIKGIKSAIEAMMEFFNSSGFKDFLDGVGTIGESLIGFIGGVGDFVGGAFSPESHDDVLITKDGSVHDFNPSDNILAFKGALPGGASVSIDFSGMQIILQQGTVEEAARVGETLVDTIRTQLAKELERGGVR